MTDDVSGMPGAGPLSGVTVIEMAAIGPVPHCGMVLAELGAAVVRIDRTAASGLGLEIPPEFDALARGKRPVALDLKGDAGREAAMDLIAGADILIEGFRPGVMERIGLGPEPCLARNPRLVYGRLSGWGEDGPMANDAGHDLNFLGLTGALSLMGPPNHPPPVPLNLVADFGGGAMQLALGVVAAAFRARTTGRGQVVASSILEGALSLTPMLYGLRAAGAWTDRRGDNVLDGGAPFYGCYEAADGRYLAVGAIEPKFYRSLLDGLGLADGIGADRQMDKSTWPGTRERFATVFRTRSRDAWVRHFSGTDACVSPVLTLDEAPQHPQNTPAFSSGSAGGLRLPRSVPRFSEWAFNPVDTST